MSKKRVKGMLLVEVLVSFSLIVLVLPASLLPYLYTWKSQVDLIKEVEIERLANLSAFQFHKEIIQTKNLNWEQFNTKELEFYESDRDQEAFIHVLGIKKPLHFKYHSSLSLQMQLQAPSKNSERAPIYKRLIEVNQILKSGKKTCSFKHYFVGIRSR